MAREDLHFRLRIPEELKNRVEAAASANHRSMTAEIIDRLEESFDGSYQPDEAKKLIGEYANSLSRENEALRKTGAVTERIVFELASAIQQAADGDTTELARQVERAKSEATLKRLISIYSIVDED